MPKLELIETGVLMGTRKLHYADLIKTAVSSAPSSGLNIQQIRVRVAVLDKVEAVEAEIKAQGKKAKNGTKVYLDLTHDELTALKASVDVTKWTIVHRDILKFVDTLDDVMKTPV